MPVLSVLSTNATLNGAGQLPVNSSTPAAGTPPDGHISTVSRAEVFGIFITLSLCLLSQPAGSLVYRRSILLWRLNPLASLAEAVLILTCVITVIIPIIFGLTIDCTLGLESPRVTPREQLGDLSTFWGRWRRRLKLATAARLRLRVETHALAAALLLIRGRNNQKTQQRACSAMDIIAELRASGLFLGENVGAGASEETAGLMPADARDGEALQQGEEGTAASAERASPQAQSAQADASRRQEQEATGDMPTSSSDSRPNGIAGNRLTADRAVILRRVYGSNVFAHREFPVQMVTLLSVTSVAVKLCVSSLPEPLVTSGIFMLLGWMAVQLLLLVFHSQDLQDTGLQALSTAVQDYAPLFDQIPSDFRLWMICPYLATCLAVAIPLSSLVLSSSVPARSGAPGPTILLTIAEWAIRLFGVGSLVVIAWVHGLGLMELRPLPLAPGAQNGIRSDGQGGGWGGQESRSLLGRSFWPAIFTVLAGLALWAGSVWDRDTDRILPLICWILITYCSTMVALILAPTLISVGTPFLPLPDSDGGAIAQRVLVFIAAYTFAIWMCGYDETVTSQSDWVKWLG